MSQEDAENGAFTIEVQDLRFTTSFAIDDFRLWVDPIAILE